MRAPQSNSKDFEQCPTGWQLGVCTRLIDVGTHWNESKQRYQRKFMIGFESEHLMKEGDFKGEPFLLFGNFNYSMYQGKAHMCTFIENWRGRRFASQHEAEMFDLAKLLRQPAYMNVVRSDCGKFTNIQVIGPIPPNMVPPQPRGKIVLIDQDNLDPAEVEKLSDKMKERVMSAEERKESNQNTPQNTSTGGYDERNPPPYDDPIPGFDQDIPF